jgi:hypothetical protein
MGKGQSRGMFLGRGKRVEGGVLGYLFDHGVVVRELGSM